MNMTSRIGNFLVKADSLCDYIPIVSTATNLIDLFVKYVVIPSINPQRIANNHYYTHVQQKDAFRCIALLIPIVGNIATAIYDFANRKYQNKDLVLHAVTQDGMNLLFSSDKLKDDQDVVLAAVRQNGWALQFASSRLKNDRDVVLAAVQQNGSVLQLVNERFKDDQEIVLASVQQDPRAIQFASPRLKQQLAQAV